MEVECPRDRVRLRRQCAGLARDAKGPLDLRDFRPAPDRVSLQRGRGASRRSGDAASCHDPDKLTTRAVRIWLRSGKSMER